VTGLAAEGPILAISPHLDDAVMAVGATIAALAETGHDVIICTVFAGEPRPPLSPVAEAFHADCGLGADAVTRRQSEDLQAARVVGAQAIHLQFPDAIYRRHGPEWLCTASRSMFDPNLPAEPALRNAIATDIARIVRETRPAAVWTCAAIGDHVDHRLTRLAVTDAGRLRGWTPALWEGIPYAMGSDPPTAICPLKHGDIRKDHLERKLKAIEHYASQIRMLWPDDEDWRALFRAHATSRHPSGTPELLWHPAQHDTREPSHPTPAEVLRDQ
jgi:LmbE family N-acetylglucosaminyl deacetylase